MGISAPQSTGNRTGTVRLVKVPTLDGTNIPCVIPAVLFSGDVLAYGDFPYGTHTDDLLIVAPRLPLEYEDVRGCFTICAENEYDEINARITIGSYTDTIVCTPSSLIPYTSKSIVGSSSNEEVAPNTPGADVTWVGGGLNISKYEKIDASTKTVEIRGSTYLPRMGGAAGTSSEKAWIGGGHTVQNVVELFVYATDLLTTGDRSNLTVSRSYLAAVNDSRYCWYWGGIDSAGVVGILDKLDKANDTVGAIFRLDEWPRCRFDAEFIYNAAYSFGGQVGVYGKDWVRYFEPSNDTVIHSAVDLPLNIYDHSVVRHLDHLCILYKTVVYNFDPTTDTFDLVSTDLPSYSQADAHILGEEILLTGGTEWSTAEGNGSSSNRVGTYNPTTNTYVDEVDYLNYRRYNHWSCGYTSSTRIVSSQVKSFFLSTERDFEDISLHIPSCNATSTIPFEVKIGERVESEVKLIAIKPTGCFHTEAFETAYNVDNSNILWKFNYNCDLPTMIGNMPSNSSRPAALTTGQKGWLIGGSGRTLTALNYTDDTLTSLIGYTDDLCESACTINKTDKGLVFGGTRYTQAFNMSLVITDAIREWSFSTDTLSNLSTTTSKKITRAASSRYSDANGYILGGSITEVHDLTDEIEKVSMETGTCSILVAALPAVTDMNQAIHDLEANIITSAGHKLDTSTETTSGLTAWPLVHGESFFTQSSTAKFIGGTVEREEDDNIDGLIKIGATENHWPYLYDHVTGTLSVCDAAIVPGFFNQPSMCPYNYCSPILESRVTVNCFLEATGAYRTWIRAIAEIPYTYTGLSAIIHDVYETGGTEKICVYTAFDQDVKECITKGSDSLYTTRDSICHISVEHNEDDINCLSIAIDRQESTIPTIMVWDQLKSTRAAVATMPNFYTGYNNVNCSLLIGGKISTRRCYIPPVYSANWDLFMNEGTLDLLIGKELGSGDFVEVLNKMVKGSGGTLNWDIISQDIEDKFGNSDFIYSIDESTGVIANEGVLVKPGESMQIINLLIRLSGTDMWVTNREGERFFLNVSKEYDIHRVGNVPITGNIMVVKLKLIEPLITGELSFEFRSARSVCHLKLMSM